MPKGSDRNKIDPKLRGTPEGQLRAQHRGGMRKKARVVKPIPRSNEVFQIVPLPAAKKAKMNTTKQTRLGMLRKDI
jgi:hypothetical protein